MVIGVILALAVVFCILYRRHKAKQTPTQADAEPESSPKSGVEHANVKDVAGLGSSPQSTPPQTDHRPRNQAAETGAPPLGLEHLASVPRSPGDEQSPHAPTGQKEPE